MNENAIDAEAVEEPDAAPAAPQTLVVRHEQAPPAPPAVAAMPLTLFGDSPAEAMARVNELASVITGEVKRRGWIDQLTFNKKGGGTYTSEHPTIEAWTFAGGLVGVFPIVTKTARIKIDGVSGWEAHAEARTVHGQIVGAADGMCMKNEDRWGHVDEFQRRSMAQTRAMSRALAGPLRFLMEQAGFAGTPAEDMGDRTAGGQRPKRTSDGADTKQEAAKGPGKAKVPSAAQLKSAAGRLRKVKEAGGFGDLELPAVVEQVAAHYSSERKKADEQASPVVFYPPDQDSDFPMATLKQLTGGAGGECSNLIDRLVKKEAEA